MVEDNTSTSDKAENINTSEIDEKTKKYVDDKFWKIRPCTLYNQEYKNCVGFKDRFYQYFVDGEMKDCSEYKRDYYNCEKWNDEKNYKSAEAVIINEETRILKRLKNHYRNNVWEQRESPPEDWAKPLPEWMQKEQENTFLYHAQKNLKEGTLNEKEPRCTIM